MEGLKQFGEEKKKFIIPENAIESGPEIKVEKGLNYKKDYNFKEVFEELESFIIPLVEKLKENIDSGEYDMLIGDDASGRLPTLVLRGIINERIRKIHPELRSRKSEIKTRFVAGGQAENSKELEGVFKKLKLEIRKKALVVTEYIHSGKTIRRFSDILEECGIPFDVAGFASRTDKIRIPKNSKFFYGSASYNLNDPPSFYDVPKMSGIVKDYEPVPYATLYKKEIRADDDENILLQENINNARKDVDLLVKKALEKVWGENH